MDDGYSLSRIQVDDDGRGSVRFCDRCGAVVGSTKVHNDWHTMLQEGLDYADIAAGIAAEEAVHSHETGRKYH